MTLKHKARYPWLFAGGCILLLPVVLSLPVDGQSRFQAAITAIGSLAAFVYFLYTQHHQDTRLFRELFTDFSKRFEGLSNDLNKIRMRPGAPGAALGGDEKRTLCKYFDLCAEEHLFHEAGYIDEQVWQAWRRGMAIFAKDAEILKHWKDEARGDSYFGFSLD